MYSSLEDIKKIIPERTIAQLTDDASGAAVNQGIVTEAIMAADEVIDSYLSGRYRLPFPGTAERPAAGGSIYAIDVSAATATGETVGDVKTIRSLDRSFVVSVSPPEDAPRVKFTLPPGTVPTSIYDSVDGDLGGHFRRLGNTQSWLSDDDYDDVGRIFVVDISSPAAPEAPEAPGTSGETPPLLRRLSADIAIFHLYGRRPEREMPKTIEMKYKDAVRMLEGIRDGKLNIGDDGEEPPETGAYRTNKKASERMFT